MSNKKITYDIGFNVDKSQLTAIKHELDTIQRFNLNDFQHIDPNADIESLRKIQENARQIGSILDASFNTKLNTVNVDTFLQKLKENNLSIGQVKANLEAAGSTGQRAFNQMSMALLNTKREIKESYSLLSKMSETLGNTIKWSIASGAINMFTGSIQKAWGYTKNLDTSLNDIRIVTDKSAESMEKFAKQANRAAKSLGAATTDYTKAALIYYQQGLGEQDVQARTEATIKAANVTGQSAAEVSEQLTAVWNGYKVVAQEAESYVDKLAAVAATTAADLEELSDGMSKVASAANAMGVNMDQLSAQLATIVSVTRQDAASVGTALKTVFARMGDLKVDGLDEFGVSLGDVSGQLKKMGIDVLDQEGNLRDMGTVIEEVAAKWGTWTDAQQQAAAVAIAGKRQYNNLMALFENWDMYESALMTSQNSAGTLQKQQDIYMESLEGHLQQLSTAGERVYDAFFNSESMKDMIDGLTFVVDLIGQFVEALGGGGNLLLMMGPLIGNILGKQIGPFLGTMTRNMQITKASKLEEEAINKVIIELQKQGVQYGSLENEQVQKLIKLKKQQLAVDKYLTAEQRKQNEALIDQQVSQMKNNQDLAEEMKESDDMVRSRFGVGINDSEYEESGIRTDLGDLQARQKGLETKKTELSTQFDKKNKKAAKVFAKDDKFAQYMAATPEEREKGDLAAWYNDLKKHNKALIDELTKLSGEIAETTAEIDKNNADLEVTEHGYEDADEYAEVKTAVEKQNRYQELTDTSVLANDQRILGEKTAREQSFGAQQRLLRRDFDGLSEEQLQKLEKGEITDITQIEGYETWSDAEKNKKKSRLQDYTKSKKNVDEVAEAEARNAERTELGRTEADRKATLEENGVAKSTDGKYELTKVNTETINEILKKYDLAQEEVTGALQELKKSLPNKEFEKLQKVLNDTINAASEYEESLGDDSANMETNDDGSINVEKEQTRLEAKKRKITEKKEPQTEADKQELANIEKQEKALKKLQEAKKNLSTENDRLKAKKKAVATAMAKATTETAENAEKHKALKQALEASGMKLEDFNTLNNKVANGEELSEQQQKEYNLVLEKYKAILGEVNANLTTESEKLQNVKTNTEQATNATKALKTESEKQAQAQQVQAYGQAVTQALGNMMALIGAVKTFIGIKDIWNNDDLSYGEKMTQTVEAILGGCLALIPVIISIVTAVVSGGISAQIAWWPILLITLAIASIAAIIIAIFAAFGKVSEKFGDNGKKAFNAASEAAEQAAEQFENAKNRFEELKASLADYNDSMDALDNLIKGTKEWEAAVDDINAKVLDLLAKYPELAGEVTTNADGVLELTPEAQKKAEEMAEKNVDQARITSISANAQKLRAGQEMLIQQRADEVFQSTKKAEKEVTAQIGQGVGGFLLGGLGGPLAGLHDIFSGLANDDLSAGQKWAKAGIGALKLGGPLGMLAGGLIDAFVDVDGSRERYETQTNDAFNTALEYFSENLDARAALADGDTTKIRDALEAALGEDSPFIDALMENTEVLNQSVDSYKANSEAIRLYNTQLADAFLGENFAGFESLGEDVQHQISESMGVALDEDSPTFKKEKDSLVSDFKDDKSDSRDQKAREYAELAGVEYQSMEWGDDGSATFIMADGTKHVASADLMATTIAQNKVLGDAMEAAQRTVATNKKIQEKLAKDTNAKDADNKAIGSGATTVASAFTTMSAGKAGDFSKLSSAQLEELKNGVTDVNSLAAKMGISTEELTQYAIDNGYETADAFYEKFVTGLNNYDATVDTLTLFKDGGLFSEDKYDNLTLVAKKNIESAYNDMKGMVGYTDEMGSAYENIIKDLNPADLEKFSTIFSSIDWSSPLAMNQFTMALEEAGIVIDNTDYNDFANAFSNAALSANTMLTNLKSVKAILKTIKDTVGDLDVGESISEEDYKELLKADPSLKKYFVDSIDGYTYIGGADFDKTIDATFKPDKYDSLYTSALSRLGEWKKGNLGDFQTREGWDALFDQDDQYLDTSNAKNVQLLSLIGVSAETYNKATPEEQRAYENQIANILYNDDGSLKTKDQLLQDQAETWLSYGNWSLNELAQYKTNGTINEETYTNFLKVRGSQVAEEAGLDKKAWNAIVENASSDELVKTIEDLQKYAFKDLDNELKSFTQALSDKEAEIEELEKAQEKLYGKDALAHINTLIQKQEELRTAEKNRHDAAMNQLGQEKTFLNLNNSALTNLGLGNIAYNDDGTVSNDTIAAIYNKAISKDITEEERTFLKGLLEQLYGYNDNMLAENENYANKIEETYETELEKQVQYLEKELSLKIDLQDARKALLEFRKKYLREDGKSILNALGGLDVYENTLKEIKMSEINFREMLDELDYDKILAANKVVRDDGSVLYDENGVVEMLGNNIDTVLGKYDEWMASLEALSETYSQLQEELMQAYDEQTERLSNINTLLQGQVTLSKLIGKTQDNTDSIMQNALYSYEIAIQKAAAARDEYAKAFDQSGKQLVTDEQLAVLEENLFSTQEAVVSSAQNTLELVVDQTIEKFKSAANDLFKSAAGMDYDYLSTRWELDSARDSRTYDEVNSAYEVYKLERDIQKSIDATTSLTAQRKLNDLKQKELDILKQKDKLTKYEVDHANAMYDLTLKQIALEEAQNSANKMKLTRDALGNYTYQYVQDKDAIAEAEAQLAEAENKLYNLNKDEAKERITEVFSLMTEGYEKWANLKKEGREQEAALVYEEYFGQNGLIASLQGGFDLVEENMKKLGLTFDGTSIQQTFDDLANVDFTKIGETLSDAYTDSTEFLSTFESDLNTYLGMNSPLVTAITTLTSKFTSGVIINEKGSISGVTEADKISDRTSEVINHINVTEQALTAFASTLESALTDRIAVMTGTDLSARSLQAMEDNTAAILQLTDSLDDKLDGKLFEIEIKNDDYSFVNGTWVQDANK